MYVSPLKNPDTQAIFLSKSNSVLKENNVLDAPPSNIDGFLSRDTCVSSTQQIRPIWIIVSHSPP
jgi:hypothetical protein